MRKLWFFVGGGLVVLAIASFVIGLVLTLRGATGTDGIVAADGRFHAMSVPAGEKRMLFSPPGPGGRCEVTEDAHPLELGSSLFSTHVTIDGTEWHGGPTFTSSTGQVSIRCVAAAPSLNGVRVRVGDPLGGGFVTGILVTILLPIVLGLAGGVILLVATIQWATRRPTSGVTA